MDKELFEAGLAVRREIGGSETIDKVMAEADGFSMPMQELVTEVCFGRIWTRPGLDRRSRSILNLGMLVAAGRTEELSGHVKGALNNGLSRMEIQECFLQAAIYLGMPAGMSSFRVARQVFAELDAEKARV
jgi:4-carboxymuconolactone decarboxylase